MLTGGDDDLIIETEAEEVEVESEPLYCICLRPWDNDHRKFMIQCDGCKDWFHGSCIGMAEHIAQDIEKYFCPKCEPNNGPTIYKVLNNRHRHDYSDKNAAEKPIQAGTPLFLQKLKEKEFASSDGIVLTMRGHHVTLPMLMLKGFNHPIKVEKKSGLELVVPDHPFNVWDVEKHVGPDHMLDVIDVQRQTDVKMSMREFAQYFTSPARNKLYNLISLEFSKTNLSKFVEAPYIARKLDWVVNSWPKYLDEEIAAKPEVSKYCLISVKDSYTDFHIDFGGSSVWYHVLSGEKIFYFIKPTDKNLHNFQRWMESTTQYETFFADRADACYRCILKKGETLFIPTGWIHGVLTTEDSLVFGGNFLHSLNVKLQLKIYEMEKKLNVPEKYLFPSLEALHWFAIEKFTEELQTLIKGGLVPAHFLQGAEVLIDELRNWYLEKDIGMGRREYIPPIISPTKLFKDLSHQIRAAKRVTGKHTKSEKIGTLKKFKEEGSNFHQENIFKDKPKLLLSNSNSPAVSPPQGGSGPPIKIKLKKTTGSRQTSPQPPNYTPDGKVLTITQGTSSRLLSDGKSLKIRFSLSDANNDNYIVESDSELLIDEEGSSKKKRKETELWRTESSKKSHKSGSSKKSSSKKKHAVNSEIDDVLAGTVNGIEELFRTSNYSERIKTFQGTSASMKEEIAGMLSFGAENDLLLNKKRKSKGKGGGMVKKPKIDEEIEKVHQDDDFIYLPLTGSDDEDVVNRRRNSSKKKRGGDKADALWSPRIKVGPVTKRDQQPMRPNAKREAVEKGLEQASEKLAMLPHVSLKHKHKKKSKSSGEKKTRTSEGSAPGTGGELSFQQKVPPTKKPKKGMATPKQRLGKILKLHKFNKF